MTCAPADEVPPRASRYATADIDALCFAAANALPLVKLPTYSVQSKAFYDVCCTRGRMGNEPCRAPSLIPYFTACFKALFTSLGLLVT